MGVIKCAKEVQLNKDRLMNNLRIAIIKVAINHPKENAIIIL